MQRRDNKWLGWVTVLVWCAVVCGAPFVGARVARIVRVDVHTKTSADGKRDGAEWERLCVPLYTPKGEIEADLVARSATWNRKTGEMTFDKPVLYQYRGGRCWRVVQGDRGRTVYARGTTGPIHIEGNVRARTRAVPQRRGKDEHGRP